MIDAIERVRRNRSIIDRLYRAANSYPGARLMIVSNHFWRDIYRLLCESREIIGAAVPDPFGAIVFCRNIRILSESHVRKLPEYAHLQQHLPQA